MRPRPLVVVAGGAVLIGVLLVGILIGRGGDSGSASDPGVPTVPAPASTTAGDPGTGAATPAAATLGPVDTEMYDIPGGLRVPRSPTAGPTVTDDFLASGFAHTPLGAAVASVNIIARTEGALGEPIYRPTIEKQVVGPHQQALLRRSVNTGQPNIPGPEDRIRDASTRIYGFTVDAYNPEESTISYLIIGPAEEPGKQERVAVQVTMRWIDEDWRLVAPADGDFSERVQLDANPAFFHPFA